MSIFKCKICGATMETYKNYRIDECTHCGTKQTVPKLWNNHIIYLYGRANHFRRSGRFDKAMPIYEQILSENSNDPESYWSVVLCRYGINYVQDRQTHDMVPVINRVQPVPLLEDEDYKTALKYADPVQEDLYRAEAEIIDKKLSDILEISKRTEKFDVFISCREEDTKGRPTQDRSIAEELYNQLTEDGYRVYFAGITLGARPKNEYPAYVYNALRSSRVMIVLGTKFEYFNDVRVRNEWSSFQDLIKKGSQKSIVLFYDNMKHSELPEEIQSYLSYNMSDFAAMRDLIGNVAELMSADLYTNVSDTYDAENIRDMDIDTLFESATCALANGDFTSADRYCNIVLSVDPTNTDAYFGKLLAECRVRERKELSNCPQPFSMSENYRSIMKYGDNEIISELQGYINDINERNLRYTFESKYQQAYKLYSESKTNKASVQKARTMFQLLAGYKDSHELIKKCDEKIIQIHKDEKYRDALVCYDESERFYNRAVQEISDSLMNKAIENIDKAEQLFLSINGERTIDQIVYQCKVKKYEYTQKLHEIREKNRIMVQEAERKENMKNNIIAASVLCSLTAVVIIISVLLFG